MGVNNTCTIKVANNKISERWEIDGICVCVFAALEQSEDHFSPVWKVGREWSKIERSDSWSFKKYMVGIKGCELSLLTDIIGDQFMLWKIFYFWSHDEWSHEWIAHL